MADQPLVEPLPLLPPSDDLSEDASRLDASVLRYVLLHRSRLNMLALDRELRGMADERGRLRLPAGRVRSDPLMRVEATLQLAVEIGLAMPEVRAWIGNDPRRLQVAVDAAYWVSECWAQDRALERRPAAPSPAPDDFEQYLLRRTRLEEQRGVPGMEPSAHRPSMRQELAALKADEMEQLLQPVLLLRAMAGEIGRLVDGTLDRAAWLRRIDERAAGPGGSMVRPPPEVIDALALPLHDKTGWIVSQRRPGDVGGFKQLRQPVELEAAYDQINAAEADWARWLAAGTEMPALACLSDRLSLLPNSPAWGDIQGLLARCARLRAEARAAAGTASGRLPSPWQELSKADQDLLVDYADTLARRAPLLQQVREFADLLARLSPTGELSLEARRRRALDLMAEGLRFRETTADAIETKVRTLIAENSAFDAVAVASHEAQAWQQARPRAVALCCGIGPGDASLAELLCAAAHIGPARWLTLDPERLTLMRWSRCLLASLLVDGVPPWLGVIALQRLGANANNLAQQNELLRLLDSRERPQQGGQEVNDGEAKATGKAERTKETDVWHTARRLGALAPAARSGPAVLLVRRIDSPMTEAWVRPPTQGLVVMATLQEFRMLHHRRPGFFEALPQPWQWRRESVAPHDPEVLQLRREVENDLLRRRWTARARARLAALFERTESDGLAVTGLDGADELFTAVTGDEG